MRVLIINKFLYPNGGSETYIFKLGEALEQHGNEVQYFGMEHEGRCVGNRVNAYTSDMDFHGGSKLSKLTYPIKTIYSKEAREKLRLVLDDFKPDVCHLNNFNYQLTPSIILEIVKWRKETGRDCKIIFTAHDYQLVCPNYMLNNPNTHQNCEKCLGGHFVNCMKGKCIHGSTAKSAIGMMEAEFWKWKGTYKYIDTMICCSEFMKTKMDSNPLFATKTVAMHNFIDKVEWKETPKKDYILYFGRFSEEKGIGTLIKVCKELPDVQFIFAGTGPLEETVNGIKNIKNVGFQKGEALEKLIREARFSIYPSEWYENCPFSVMESQMYGTPVLGADIGGIPELIQVGKTGELFESGNAEDLKKKIEKLWGDKKLCAEYSANCKDISFDTIDEYYEKIMKVYRYNVEKYLDRCINSIVGQTYRNLEIILVDDGSPDGCPEMCDAWRERDSRIKVIHKKNAGLGYARNTGIDNATGEYLCFVDSDDAVQFIYMKKKVKFTINMKALTKGLISTAVMALSVYIIMQFKLPNTIGLILEILCGIIAYTAVNLVMKNTLIFEIVNKVKGKISHKA